MQCTNCGAERNESHKFCLNCGTEFSQAPLEPQAPPAVRKPISSKQRKWRVAAIIAGAAVLATGVGGHLYMEAKYDPARTIAAMNQAFSTNQPAEFLSYFTVGEGVIVDDKGFYAFMEDQDWPYIRDWIQEETNLLKNEGLANIIEDTDGNKLITVVSEPVLFGLYEDISFLVHPVNVFTEFDFDESTLTVGEKLIEGNSGERMAVGKFLPGNYKWKAVAASTYAPIEGSGTAHVKGNGSNSFTIEPDLNAGMVELSSDVADAVLWVNGKSTKKTVKELAEFGPIPYNKSVELTAETKNENGELVKGELVKIDSGKAHITFAHVQERQEALRQQAREEEQMEELVYEHEYYIHDFIDSFRYEFESALNYADFSYIASFFPAGSKVQTEYRADIDRHGRMDEYYNYYFDSTIVTDIEAVDSETLVATTQETFTFESGNDYYDYIKTKAYTIDVDGGYFITDIETLTSDSEQY
ncbi:TcaA 3rd/4th domain-containing protein [Planococcus lenghuensis]|uniref:Zinc ribbon domain-containing protein n=1 Tax=Planococcus lenghuensis TaxID=2213202 RepID=A0A1Q2L154_9BACL|nr:hypothetical protein [Planococcus lenghuensis]AQQ54169.1 hypothetical protein B0X71_14350 [Planococcus lenghuensis]